MKRFRARGSAAAQAGLEVGDVLAALAALATGAREEGALVGEGAAVQRVVELRDDLAPLLVDPREPSRVRLRWRRGKPI